MTRVQQEIVLFSLETNINALKSVRAKAIKSNDKALITNSQHIINGFKEVIEIVKAIPLEEDVGPYVWED